MTQEVLDQEVAEPTAEQLQQEEQAAFEAGFSSASGDEPPAAEPPEQVDPETVLETEQQEELAPEEEPILPEFGMTASQVREYLAEVSDLRKFRQETDQHRDRLYGMVGSLKQQLQEVSSKSSAAPRELSPADMAELEAAFKEEIAGEYPELGELSSRGMSKAFSLFIKKLGVAPAVAPSAPAQAVPEAPTAAIAPPINVDEIERRVEQKLHVNLLAREHPDWRDVATSTDFKLWKDGLPAEQRQLLDTSWDSGVISQGLSAFKQWYQQQTQRVSSKKQRLERAIQPSGVPATSDTATDYDAFLAGFSNVRGIK